MLASVIAARVFADIALWPDGYGRKLGRRAVRLLVKVRDCCTPPAVLPRSALYVVSETVDGGTYLPAGPCWRSLQGFDHALSRWWTGHVHGDALHERTKLRELLLGPVSPALCSIGKHLVVIVIGFSPAGLRKMRRRLWLW